MLSHLEVLQVYNHSHCTPAARAVRFAAGLASQMGAKVLVENALPNGCSEGFYKLDETRIKPDEVDAWALDAPDNTLRIALECLCPGESKRYKVPTVTVELEKWQTEETLFARSGIAYLLGDPAELPLVPKANFGAHTVGYAMFAALTGLATKRRRFGTIDDAVINAEGVLAWINWKSAVAASLGVDNKRQGKSAEWPVLKCRDGYAAFVFNERDWPEICDMVNDPQLRSSGFSTFEGRQADREGYMTPIRSWFLTKSKAELTQEFVKRAIPGAAACTISDLLSDPLLTHRGTFQTRPDGVTVPRPPFRIADEVVSGESSLSSCTATRALPLAGMRVLDFGIITAGAGVSALLADMGADVIKVESRERFDPFRIWPGGPKGKESPVFKSNNRNKRAIVLDLKSKDGVSTFLELARSADIVLENYRRGVLDRLGLSLSVLRKSNPNILLASISSQGLDGPGAEHTTFGSTLEASSGFAAVTSYEDGRPVISGRNLNFPDQIVCLYGAAMIAATAVDCQAQGVARHIDVSQRDCAIYQLGDEIAQAGVEAEKNGTALHEINGPLVSAIVRCADGECVALTAYTEAVVQLIADLKSDTLTDLEEWASRKTAEEAVSTFLNAGGGGTYVRKGKDILEDPNYAKSEIFTHSPGGALVKGFPFQFIDTPMEIWGDSPSIGQHTAELLENLEPSAATK